MNKLFNWKMWVHGLVGATIGGMANAITIMIVDPVKFNFDDGLADLVKVTVISAIVSAALYVKTHPVE